MKFLDLYESKFIAESLNDGRSTRK